MVAKKHTTPTTSNKTTQGRQRKDDTNEAVPAETPTPAELTPVESGEAASAPTPETMRIDTPMPAVVETLVPDPTLPNPPAPVKKLSAVDAAARVLQEIGQAMSCTELIAAMAAKGYWSSPTGRTPAGTLYSAVLREIQSRGDQSRFRKTARGQFALRETV
jgi:hypothetical protein